MDPIKKPVEHAIGLKTRIVGFVKAHKLVSSIIALVAFIIIVFFGAQIWLYLNFVVGNDIVVSLASTKESVAVTAQDPQRISFEAAVKTNPFCSVICNASFIDISHNILVDNTSFSISPRAPINQDYLIQKSMAGAGQVLYKYSMECVAKQTLFCHTNGEKTSRNILITSENILTNQEQEDLIDLGINAKELYYNISTKLDSVNTFIQVLPSVQDVSEKDYAMLYSYRTNLESLLEDFDKVQEYWDGQNYVSLSQLLSTINKKYADLYDPISDLLFQISSDINAVNEISQSSINSRSILLSISDDRFYDSNISTELNNTVDSFNEAGRFFFRSESLSDVALVFSQLEAEIMQLAQKANSFMSAQAVVISSDAILAQNSICEYINCTLDNRESISNYTRACNYVDNIYQIYLGNNSSIDNENFTSIFSQIPGKCPSNVSYTKPSSFRIDPILVSSIESNSSLNLGESFPQCCAFGKCDACCLTQDCLSKSTAYPVVFVHGHAPNKDVSAEYSLDAFVSLQNKLEEDGYVNAGAISLYSGFGDYGVWGKVNAPVSVKLSYYYDIFEEPENYIIIQTKSENIETYSVRLKELIDVVKHRTGRSKVDIIAHSMGGLVVKRYLQVFGAQQVDKLVYIGVPHQGIGGSVQDFCPLLGEKLECRDMSANSDFLRKLNSGNTPNVPTLNIVGAGCSTSGLVSDGIVSVKSASLPNNNVIINGTCRGFNVLHTDLLKVEKYPKVYEEISEFI